ncbi:DNA polymerase III subunit alpha [Candidatus Wolfebacteria bacterium]|nr:DNA polymerase III subunit alpha [Candidatus Wolfebacteria bacterium]
MKFIHLHTHSHYSLLDGLTKISDLVSRAKELGMDALALTDHGVLYGAIEFYKEANKQGIKPILGIEIYIAPKSRFDKTAGKGDDKYFHLTLLAENNEGWKNLIQLATKASLEGFYYKPRVDKDLLREYHKGLIAMSGCPKGEIPQFIINNNFEAAEKAALEYEEIFGKGNFFLEIGHHPNIAEVVKAENGIVKIHQKTGIPLVATQDIHYLRPEDAQYQDILLAVQTGNKLSDDDRLTLKADDFSMFSAEQAEELFKDFPEAIVNTVKIAERCNVKLALGQTLLPSFPLEGIAKSANEYLEKILNEKLFERYPGADAKVKERLAYELGVIEKTKFADYFLIVQDIVNWAKDHGIAVGPGRGSAAGSIVAYILGITGVDPLKYDLLFERFLNPERIAMPDIDIDFADKRRDEIFAYIREKYGSDRVAQIITFGTMAARGAVRDATRALSLPYSLGDQIAKLIPFGSDLEEALKETEELKEIYKNNPDAQKIIDSARHLEGVARHASVHACGVVISRDPLVNHVPLQYAPQDTNTIITQFEMGSIEDLGLLKMDFLGLKNLTIIEDAIRLIKEMRNENLDISKIPLDDKKTFELLQKAETTSVFQLECLSGDTQVSTTTLKKLYERKNKKVLHSLYFDEGKVHKNRILDIVRGEKKELYALITENDWYIKASKDHYFFTKNGWKKLGNIKIGEKVLIKSRSQHFLYNTCKTCGRQINGQKEAKSKFCYKCSASFYRNPSKKESREKIRVARMNFYNQGGRPWNQGLTAENNETLRKASKKISKALRGRPLEELWGKERAEKFKKEQSKRTQGENNPMFGKPSPHRKGGFRKDLGHYVRSNWEADFARILNLYGVKYEYEPKIFELVEANGQKLHYTPDFYTPQNNTFYEVKGWMRDLDSKKIELFKKQYSQYKFILINTARFAELALRFKDLIKWECPRMPPESQFNFIKVKEIKYSGKELTYDIVMQAPGNNYMANGFVVHNSDGMRRYLKELKPTELEDIIAMNALYRPGPMELIPSYIKRKHKLEKIHYLHPKLEPILEKTYGIGIYQEQMMRIARDLAGFTLAEADTLRKAIGKKIKELLDVQKEKIISGMLKNGIFQKTAEAIWELFPPFAKYGFNRSHAACYALIGYQTAYLKAHYQIEFTTALFNADAGDVERIAFLINETKKTDIKVLPPDINKSFVDFTPEEKNIRFGLLAVKNVGAGIVEAIIDERFRGGPFEDFTNFLNRVNHKDLNKKSLESLVKAGAFDSLNVERGLILANMENILSFSQSVKKSKLSNQNSLFGSNYQAHSLKLVSAPPASAKEKFQWEKELVGLYISEHPLSKYAEKLQMNKVKPIKIVKEIKEGQSGSGILRIAGIVGSIKKINTKTGKPMIFAKIEDLSDNMEVVVFEDTLKKNIGLWTDNNILIIEGRISWRDHEPKIIVSSAMELN